MSQKEKIQQEIEDTLQSLDGATRANANPFLFTRIQARRQKKAGGWEAVFSFVSKPAIAIAIVVIVMAVNGWAVWDSDSSQAVTADNGNASASELAIEYNVVASVNNYDYENMTNE